MSPSTSLVSSSSAPSSPLPSLLSPSLSPSLPFCSPSLLSPSLLPLPLPTMVPSGMLRHWLGLNSGLNKCGIHLLQLLLHMSLTPNTTVTSRDVVSSCLSRIWFQMILTSSATCVTTYIGSITGYTQFVPCHLASLYMTSTKPFTSGHGYHLLCSPLYIMQEHMNCL